MALWESYLHWNLFTETENKTPIPYSFGAKGMSKGGVISDVESPIQNSVDRTTNKRQPTLGAASDLRPSGWSGRHWKGRTKWTFAAGFCFAFQINQVTSHSLVNKHSLSSIIPFSRPRRSPWPVLSKWLSSMNWPTASGPLPILIVEQLS